MTKLLERMRRNSADDWQISDVERVCRQYGVSCAPPKGGGSHYKLELSDKSAILIIPARRPIKAVYIERLVKLLDKLGG
jgi:hypothetical protein